MNKFNILFSALSSRDRIYFAKRLSLLLRAGIAILPALDMLAKSSPGKRTQHMHSDIYGRIANGAPLHSALLLHKTAFGLFFINVVKLGETAGTLPESLEHIALELERKHTLQKKIAGALIYPAIILTATIAITTLLLVGIFPKILPVFLSLKTELPLSTKIVIVASNFLKESGLLTLGLMMCVCIGTFFALRIPMLRRIVDTGIIRTPLVGRLSVHYNIAVIARTLGVLLKSGVHIVPALEIAKENIQNTAYKKLVNEIIDATTGGRSMSGVLGKNPTQAPQLLTQLVAVGETTGALSDVLLHSASVYESEIDDLSKNLLQFLEPILMVVMGSLVGFIAISIITPIYGISQNLHR